MMDPSEHSSSRLSSGSFGFGGGGGSSGFASSMADVSSRDSCGSKPRISAASLGTSVRASRTSDFTVDKLRFETLGLCGREKEILQLQRCFEDATSAASGQRKLRQLIPIGGLSGTGKSALAETLRDTVAKKKNNKDKSAVFIAGKCLPDEPYSGIASACQDLCQQVAEKLPEDSITERFQKEMGEENVLLVNHLAKILPPEKSSSNLKDSVRSNADSSDNVDAGSNQAKSQLNHAFCRFVQCAGSMLGDATTIVLALDDVQWADQASLDLVKALLQDKPDEENNNSNNNAILITATYRSDEIGPTHPFTKMVEELKKSNSNGGSTTDTGGIHITDLPVGNLTIVQVHDLVMQVLSIDDDHTKTMDLAALCFKRTLGNVLFLRRFLTMLHQEKLIKFHYGQFSWTWDVAIIEEQTSVTTNVVDLLRVKMSTLCPDLQRLLTLASFLGSSFDWDLISLVWKQEFQDDDDDKGNRLKKCMSMATEEAFLETCTDQLFANYRWTHDKVREAASSLVSSDQAIATQFRLGNILFNSLDGQTLDTHIFLITNLLNATDASLLSKEERMQIGQLNLQAATKAKNMSAYESSATYADKGLQMVLPAEDSAQQQQQQQDSNNNINKWPKESFQLLLDLYSVGAYSEYAVGNPVAAEDFCNQVLKQGDDVSVSDKLRVYHVLLEIMASGGRPKEAIALGMNVLNELGYKFPSNSGMRAYKAVTSFLSVTSKKNMPTREDILALPEMTDPVRKEAMKIMDLTCSSAYLCADTFVLLLLLSRLVKWTLKYGYCPSSPGCLAWLGCLVCHAKGNHELGMKWGDYSLLLMSVWENKVQPARCALMVESMIRAWSTPFKTTLKPLLIGYKAGMVVGDGLNSSWCLYHIIHNAFLSGKKLRKVEEDCRSFSFELQAMRQTQVREVVVITWQAILNLMGRSNGQTTMLQGDAFEETEFFAQDDNQSFSIDHVKALKSILYCIYSEHDAGAEFAVERGNTYLKESIGCPLGMQECFARALSLYDAARRHTGQKRRKYRKHAIAAKSTLRAMLKHGNPNVLHLMKFLEAEHAAFRDDLALGTQKYEEAIMFAGRAGHIQDMALANERLAEFLASSSKRSSKDIEEARFRMEKAIEYYDEWGAAQKSSLLRARLSDGFPEKDATNSSGP